MYDYKSERERMSLGPNAALRDLIGAYDALRTLCQVGGAARMQEIMDATCKRLGAIDTFRVLACIDTLLELELIVEITTTLNRSTQGRVFATSLL